MFPIKTNLYERKWSWKMKLGVLNFFEWKGNSYKKVLLKSKIPMKKTNSIRTDSAVGKAIA